MSQVCDNIFIPHDQQHRRQRWLEIMEPAQHPRQREYRAAEAEHRKNVARKDDERIEVIAKIAGIESTAKIRSLNSIATRAAEHRLERERPCGQFATVNCLLVDRHAEFEDQHLPAR